MSISNGDQMPEGSLKMMTDSVVKDKSTADMRLEVDGATPSAC